MDLSIVMLSVLFLQGILQCTSSIGSACMPIPDVPSAPNYQNLSLDTLLGMGKFDTSTNGKGFVQRQAIFVLGNTGTGKTTAVQIMAGNLSRLHATNVGGNLVIFDEDHRIGPPSSVSKTLFPELVTSEVNDEIFWDCPGFSDTRSAKVDIAAMYYIKRALEATHFAKFVAITTHISVTKGGPRNTFPELARHMVHLIDNHKLFEHSTALLVTKVSNFDHQTGKLLTSDELLSGVVQYLQQYLAELQHKKSLCSSHDKCNEILGLLRLLEGLLRDVPKIFFIRGPKECGTLFNMEHILESRKNISYQLRNYLQYSAISPSDFRITAKDSTVSEIYSTFVPETVAKIKTITENLLGEAGGKFLDTYPDKNENDIQSIVSRFKDIYNISTKVADGVKEDILATTQHLELLSRHLNEAFDNPSIVLIQQYQEHLEFYQYISGQGGKLSGNFRWSDSVRQFHDTVIARARFYSFCLYSSTKLKENSMQRRLRTYLKNNGRHIDLHLNNVLHFLEKSETISISDELKSTWNSLLRVADKMRLLSIIKNCVPVLRTCRVPTSQNREISANDKDLEEILADGIAQMDQAVNTNHAKRDLQAKSAIFVMGNTGSGKTTATYIMEGDLSKMHAVYDQESLVIVDEAAFISSSTVSKTLVPRNVLPPDTSEYTIWDCPGFNDNRGPDRDIAAMYFLKHALDTNHFGKFLFTVPHSSVKTGMDRSDFGAMATHAVRLIKNISQVSASIGLVITKVDNYLGEQYLSHKELMRQVIGFLTNYIADQKALLTDASDPQKSEFEQRIKFVTGLINNSTGVPNPRIGFIRTPDDCGSLNEFSEVVESRNNIRSLYKKLLLFSSISPDKFNISLGANTLYEVVNNLAPAVVQKTESISCGLVHAAKEDFTKKFYEYLATVPSSSINFLKNADAALQTYLESYRNNHTKNSDSFPNGLEALHKKMGLVTGLCSQKFFLQNLDSQLRFYREVTLKDTQLPFVNPLYMPCFDKFSRFLANKVKFYEFCNSTISQLKEYRSQKMLHDLYKQKPVPVNNNNVLEFVTRHNLILGYSDRSDLWSKVESQDRDYYKITVANYFPSMQLKCKTHSNTQILLITGKFLLISEAFTKPLWNQVCGSNLSRIKEVQIAASEVVFFDNNIEEIGRELNLAIAAPTWKVLSTTSQPKIYITLNGARGKNANGYKMSRGIATPRQKKNYDERYDPKPNGLPGRNGLDGGRGGNSGSFYGLSQVVLGGENLIINAIGGDGGNGYNGEMGERGKQGNKASSRDFGSAYSGSERPYMINGQYECGVGFKKKTLNLGFGAHIWFSIKGQRSGRGGNGGNGGNAGPPGKHGSIVLQTFSGERNWTEISKNGKCGLPGQGGQGGQGTKNGQHVSCKLINALVAIQKWTKCRDACQIAMTISEDGSKGLQGRLPTTSYAKLNPYTQSYIIRQYKYLVVGQLPISTFLKNLEGSSLINTDVLIISFAEELQSLLNLNLITTHPLSLEKHLAIFFERLIGFASSRMNLTTQQKGAVSEIISVALGQRTGLQRQYLHSTVISADKFLNAIANRLPLLKVAASDKIIAQINKNFTEKISVLGNQTLLLIEKNVQPSIEQAWQHMEIVQQQLVAQINQILRETEYDLQKKKDLKAKLERAAVLNGFLRFFATVGSAVSFLGPVGLAIGNIITIGTSIAQSLVVQPKLPKVSVAIPSSVLNTMSTANKHIFQMEIQHMEKMANAVKAADKELGNEQLKIQVNLAENVTKLALATKNEMNIGNIPKFLKSKESLDTAAKELRLSTFDWAANNNKKQKQTRVNYAMNKLLLTMFVVDGIENVIIGVNRPESDLEDIIRMISEVEKHIIGIETKKMEFYTEFVPMLDSMYTALEAETHHLSGKSQAALQVKGWQMKSLLQNMRQYVKYFATGFPAEENLQLCIFAIDEAITLLLRLYDHLEILQDKKELADYIANVNMAGKFYTGNSELDTAIKSLSFLVQANLFLDEYNIAKQAFKQWVFPFAEYYLSTRHINYTTKASLDEVLTIYTREIEYLKQAITLYRASIAKTDELLHFETFSSDAVTTEPFFVWENDQWQDSIKKLLSGKGIILKADPSMHRPNKRGFFKNKSAIKFQHIEVKLKAVKDCVQDDLDNKLRYFGITMLHHGHSVYRVNEIDYIIQDKPQTYKYSFEINANGHVSRNGVQYKIKGPDTDFMMSPYTWWGIEITDPKPHDDVGFQDLAKFSECVDIELEGEGVYLNELEVTSEFLHNLKLEDHYEVYNNGGNIHQAADGFIDKACIG